MFNPQKYVLEDIVGEPFIDMAEIRELLDNNRNKSVDDVIQQATSRVRLNLEQVATLLGATISERQKVMDASRKIKQDIYGKRIVLFAPL